jgi:hypothetical protein
VGGEWIPARGIEGTGVEGEWHDATSGYQAIYPLNVIKLRLRKSSATEIVGQN